MAQPPLAVQEVLVLCGNYSTETSTCVDAQGNLTTPTAELAKLHIRCKYGIEAKEKATVYCLQPERAED